MENTATLEETLKKLSEQVSHFTDTTKLTNNVNTENSGILGKIPSPSSSIMYYGLIPLGILILLFITKPSLILVEELDISGVPQKKLNYSKLLGWTLCFTGAAAVIIFAIYYKKNKPLAQ